jgi:DNA (cytosine-5)-methyltransferase 1
MTFGELFAGIGGFSLGLERAGMECKWQVEIDPYARAVLKKHWPEVPKHEDVRTFPPQGDYSVDLICGGFPCQDISLAGKGAGLAGARSGLWYEFARIIGEIRPRYVLVENVAALATRGLDAVLGTLSTLGYDAEWHVIPASAVGAPHRRERVWIVAYAHGRQVHRLRADARDGGTIPSERQRREFRGGDGGEDVAYAEGIGRRAGLCQDDAKQDGHQSGDRCGYVADAPGGRPQGNRSAWDEVSRESLGSGLASHGSGDGVNGWWSVEPNVGRVAHGVPSRVDRLRSLGNAVVPQVVEIIGRAILAHEERQGR